MVIEHSVGGKTIRFRFTDNPARFSVDDWHNVVCVMAAPEGIEHIRKTFPEDTTIWCAAIDGGLNEHKYIVPGFGDAGDLCYGGKI